MEVEILSKEIIKPSSNSQTSPYHLKSIKLSILDQLSPLTYTSIIFFYALHQKKEDHDFNLIDKLKISLSETLSKYYPLAGTIKDNQTIFCNGQGALFQEARVNVSMEQFLNQPRLFELLSKLVPCRAVLTETSNVQIAVQLNAFGCGGGVALAACFLHKIMDGSTVSSFIKSWSSVTRGGCFDDDGQIIDFVDYDIVSSLFPLRDLSSFSGLSWLSSKEYSPFICRGKNCTRRFVFESDAISDLKEKAKSEAVQNPTCVEVITGFIWKYAIKAAREMSGSQRPSVLTHAVNLRRRMEPPLPETSIGNIFSSALAYFDSSNAEIELNELVNLLRKSFQEIDNNYIQKMTGKEGFKAISNSLIKIQDLYSRKPDSYGFTSWRNMGLNDVDFGLGKPSWVSFAGLADSVLRNVVILKETISGDGIEVWVILDEEEMKILENNQDFLAFASLDPSIHIA